MAPSSTPLNPPKDTDASPPAARTAVTTAATAVSEETGCAASPFQAGVQPPPLSTNARLKKRAPDAFIASVMLCGWASSGMK
ncbi:MAG: hypothetical protein QOI74_2319 [Micromonosporaceae bacterium]|nr:hypothetical protein [Micromonosporaceae bacterium]